MLRNLLFLSLYIIFLGYITAEEVDVKLDEPMQIFRPKVRLNREELKNRLTEVQFNVTQLSMTEDQGSGIY